MTGEISVRVPGSSVWHHYYMRTPGGGEADPTSRPEHYWEPESTDKPCQVLGDSSMDDRTTTLNQTNMTCWPYTFDPSRGRVSISSHPSVNLERNFAYAEWIEEMIGSRNWENFTSDGDGNMDGASLWGMKTLLYGTNLVNGTGTITQSGSKFELLETMDFGVVPVRTGAGWTYMGRVRTPATDPHLFVGRVNRVKSALDTWQTANGINYTIDKGEKDKGAKGTERWPFFSNVPVALYHSQLAFYPCESLGTLPFTTEVFRDSLIVDGRPILRSGGRKVTVVQLLFTHLAVYGVTSNGEVYLLEETLVRGMVDDTTAFGTALDWRVYSNYMGLNRRKAWQPDIGWTRGIDW